MTCSICWTLRRRRRVAEGRRGQPEGHPSQFSSFLVLHDDLGDRTFVGLISYELYLVHEIFIVKLAGVIAGSLKVSPALSLCVGLVLSVCAATALHWAIGAGSLIRGRQVLASLAGRSRT